MEAVLDGRKTATSRRTMHPIGVYMAVSGSRFKAKPFAIIQITSVDLLRWKEVIKEHYKEEGFVTQTIMIEYVTKEKLCISVEGLIYFHPFKVLEKL